MSVKETISHTWVIKKFSTVRDRVLSPNIRRKSNPNQYFIIQFFPNNNKTGWTDYASICLATNDEFANVNYTISLVDSNGNKKFSKDMSASYKDRYLEYGSHYYVRSSLLHDPSNELIKDNSLEIHCEIHILDDEKQDQPTEVLSENVKIAEDFYSLLENGKFSDAVLMIGEKQFQVHKNILAARSPVFSSMFEHECKEKLNNRIELADIEVEVCEELLRYIYSGKIGLLKEYALELFIAADKYQLDSLKSICGKFLSCSMSIETVCKVLAYADMHNEVELRSKCVGFITENCTEVMATDGWKQLTKTRPELLIELYQDIATKYKK